MHPYRTPPALPEPIIAASDPRWSLALLMAAFGGIRIAVAVANAEPFCDEVGLAYALAAGGAYLWFRDRVKTTTSCRLSTVFAWERRSSRPRRSRARNPNDAPG
jgi:hypothetical protein